MREIKFRAWDSKTRKYISEVPTLEVLLDDPDAPISHRDIDEMDALYYYPEYPLGDDFDGRIIYEQFTGVQDKNDKDIYEGDIVRIIEDSMWKHNGIYTVGYDRGSFNLTHKSLTAGFRTLLDLDFSKIEVIGNIHENPELLEK